MLFKVGLNYHLFEVEKFCGFHGLIDNHETFPVKHFRSDKCLKSQKKEVPKLPCGTPFVIKITSEKSLSVVHTVSYYLWVYAHEHICFKIHLGCMNCKRFPAN